MSDLIFLIVGMSALRIPNAQINKNIFIDIISLRAIHDDHVDYPGGVAYTIAVC